MESFQNERKEWTKKRKYIRLVESVWSSHQTSRLSRQLSFVGSYQLLGNFVHILRSDVMILIEL